MDDKYDTYKTANIEINHNFVLNAWLIFFFLELHHTCEIGLYIF
jgi:hypothetical protein